MTVAEALAEIVRSLRERALLSQEELAARTALSVGTIRGIETGRIRRPHQASVRRLADALTHGDQDRERLLAAARGEPTHATAPAAGEWRAPAQLPAGVATFAGRADAIKALDDLLPLPGPPPGTVVITAIAGTAGIGKTALAVHWAHRVRDRFPDGQLYANLRGFDPGGSPAEPATVLRGFLETLGVPPQRIPSTVDAQGGLYRSLLSGRRILIMLDNARDADQVRPLLPGAPGCLALVTSRDQLAGLVTTESAHPIVLDLLPAAEARQLLTARIGAERIAAEPDAVDQIIDRCARLPLALAIVAARAAVHPEHSLSALAEQLRHGAGLDAMAGSDEASDIRAVFSWSYRALTAGAARLFRLLGLHPGPDVAPPAAASLAGIPLPEVRGLLDQLTAAHLVTDDTPGRYAMHDLLRAYAAELTTTTDPDADRRAALHRLFDHYLHTLNSTAGVMFPDRIPITLPAPHSGVTVGRLDTYELALTWCGTEYAVLRGIIELAAEHGFDAHAWQTAERLSNFLKMRLLWRDWIEVGQFSLAAARRAGNRSGQARAHRVLGVAFRHVGRHADARRHSEKSLDLFREEGDRAGQAQMHVTLGVLCAQRNDIDAAMWHARQSLELYEAVGHQAGQADALSNIAWFHARLGDSQQAVASSRQALLLHRNLGSRHDECRTLHTLAYAHHQLGQYREAISRFGEALELARALSEPFQEALVLTDLGDAHLAAGDTGAAREAWRQALRLLRDLDHPDAQRVEAKLRSLSPEPPSTGRPRERA